MDSVLAVDELRCYAILEEVDECLLRGEFDKVDRMLEQAECRQLSSVELLAFIMASRAAAEKLRSFTRFREYVEYVLRLRHPKEWEEMMHGFF